MSFGRQGPKLECRDVDRCVDMASTYPNPQRASMLAGLIPLGSHEAAGCLGLRSLTDLGWLALTDCIKSDDNGCLQLIRAHWWVPFIGNPLKVGIPSQDCG